MTTTLQCNDEIFPGYVLSDRLGSGGYAEVWRARAPGGIEKAIKFVYGYYDEELAAQEMKAMERIKDVRHPFLLSLERFEVVDGRLAILTELADMSLDQRARQCRAEGLAGIPRDELLRYLSDAAEALDFLSQKHGLQHLDIKPENLLISGDHIKVADFGLVKELTTRTQNSLVAGMTPTYASPEMFDDLPSAHSDQYSLSILYQEMLIGTLPFPGRTAAQLAKQHTQAEPQLTSLPVQDRPTIARALAKIPEQRFASCRDFVESLKSGGVNPASIAKPAAPADPVSTTNGAVANHAGAEIQRTQPRDEISSPIDDTEHASGRTTHRRPAEEPIDVTRPVVRDLVDSTADPSPDVLDEAPIAEEIADVAVPDFEALSTSPRPTLYIGIGGVGIQSLCRLRHALADRLDLDAADERIQMAALDTDRSELRDACSRRWKHPLHSEDTIHLSLRLPKSYDEDCRESLAWLSRRWLYNIPRSLETRGYRPLGRVALVDHGAKVRALLDKRIARLVGADEVERGGEQHAVRVVILSGMGGGTGTGMLIDVANAVRSLGRARNVDIDVDGFLFCGAAGRATSAPLVVANTYALLVELTHVFEAGNQGTERADGVQQLFESPGPPFDAVYCVPLRGRAASGSENDSNAVVKYLATEATTTAGEVLKVCRQARTEKELQGGRQLRLKTLGFASLKDEKRQLLNRVAAELGRAIKRYWLMESQDDPSPSDSAHPPRIAKDLAPATMSDTTSHDVANGSSRDAWRPRFGKYASTRFVRELVSHIERCMNDRDEKGRAAFTLRHAQGLVAALAPAIGSIATDISQPACDAPDRANAPHGEIPDRWIGEGSSRVLMRLVDELGHPQIDPPRVVELIESHLSTECRDMLEAELRSSSGAVPAAFANSAGDIAHTAERASTDLLRCGYDRRMILLVPRNGQDRSVADRLKEVRPLAAVVAADTEDEIVICEGAGISPRSLARRLERLYPDIADAARRLFTRIDIDWKDLG